MNATVEAFSRAYEEATPDEQAALRAWMRNIVLPRDFPRSDLGRRHFPIMRGDWQRHVTAATGYVELGMFDDAAAALEGIAPEDKTRTAILGVRLTLYLAAKKWEMAAAVASHLVKVHPENALWWIDLASATRGCESLENAQAILLRASELHRDNAMIEFNLACFASVADRCEEAKFRLKRAIELDHIRGLALEHADLRPLWKWVVDNE
jgi:tetratricopeptide (TPR) repeat protein